MSNKVLTGNITDSFKTSNKSVRRLMCTIRFNTATTITVAYDKILLKATLTRNGKKHNLFNANLNLLGRFSNFFAGVEPVTLPGTYNHALSATSYLLPVVIDMGGSINLNGSDVIETEIQQLDGWLGANGQTTSNITYEWREDIGNETFIPEIQTIMIPPSSSEITETLGDNITDIGIICTSGVALTDASRLVDSVSIDSDRYDVSDTIDKMIARRATQFETLTAATFRGHSFVYVPNTEIDNCTVQMKLQSANVTSGALAIVYRRQNIDGPTIERARKRHNKHSAYNDAKIMGAGK